MQKNEIICDKCGRKTQTLGTKNDVISLYARIDLWGVGKHRSYSPQRIDLCKTCYEKFVTFLEEGEQE